MQLESVDKQCQNGENGSTDPSTSNLLALAKLYGVSAEQLLKTIEQ